jgi:hypothetical protein
MKVVPGGERIVRDDAPARHSPSMEAAFRIR